MSASTRLAWPVLTLALFAACDSGSGNDGTGTPSTPPPSPTSPGPSTPSPSPTTSPTATEPPEDPGPPAVRFIGRFDERDTNGPICGWPGCRAIANFEGTTVSVKFKEQAINYGPSVWEYAIDDGAWQTLPLADGPGDYTLASNLPQGKHKVEVYKVSEAQNGVTQFLGFDFHGGTLDPPPLRQKRKLEIVGDSDVAGFGYVGALTGSCLPGPDWAAALENYRLAWGERLSQKLNAEMNSPVFSGKGFYYNIWRPDLETIGVLYPRSNPEDPTSVFDLTKFIPDVVVVSIGGNDYNIGQPEDFGAAPLAGFTQKADEMTTMLRQNYPQAHIFLMAYAVLTDEYPPGRGRRTNVVTALTTVTQQHNAAGDSRVYYVAPSEAVETELTACDGHGGPEYHERIAVYMAEEIAKRTGWN